jgi:predicted permease
MNLKQNQKNKTRTTQDLKLFLSGLLFFAQALFVTRYWPMDNRSSNFFVFAATVGNTVLSVVLLTLSSASSPTYPGV